MKDMDNRNIVLNNKKLSLCEKVRESRTVLNSNTVQIPGRARFRHFKANQIDFSSRKRKSNYETLSQVRP